jgi:hypothetical protein
MLAASPRADSSVRITLSTFPGSKMASQVNGGLIDIHTVPCATVIMTDASIPCIPLTQTCAEFPRAHW